MLSFKQFIAESKEQSLEDFSIEELREFMQTEEFEQLDELSKSTLGSYIGKAAANMSSHDSYIVSKRGNWSSTPDIQKRRDKSANRAKGITAAVKRLTKEQEQE